MWILIVEKRKEIRKESGVNKVVLTVENKIKSVVGIIEWKAVKTGNSSSK